MSSTQSSAKWRMAGNAIVLINGAVNGPARFVSYSFRAAAQEALSASMDLAVAKEAFVSILLVLVGFQEQCCVVANEVSENGKEVRPRLASGSATYMNIQGATFHGLASSHRRRVGRLEQ